MPTYNFKCQTCGQEYEVIRSMRDHAENPRPFVCCGQQAERHIVVAPGFSGINNALAGDRHYEGMRAPDGTDISSRSKHREYMRRTGLTTVDDFKSTWARAADERRRSLAGEDRTRTQDIIDAARKVEAGYKPVVAKEES